MYFIPGFIRYINDTKRIEMTQFAVNPEQCNLRVSVISTKDTYKYPMYMYSNTLYTVTMTHIICGINLSCCSLNQVLYNGCVTLSSCPHQSSGSMLHMRRVDQYNTHELLTVSKLIIIIVTQSFVTGAHNESERGKKAGV